MSLLKIFYYSSFFILFIGKINAQHAAINEYMQHIFDNQKFMGSVAISLADDMEYYTKSVGFRDVQTKALIDKDTKFAVGSISKTYTAVLILKAIEEDKLKLEDKLANYYPQFENADKITITHLLKHRSGLFNMTEIPTFDKWEESYHDEADFLALILQQKNNFPAGEQYEYSNTNYQLLGYILQRIYGKSYDEILQEKICKPLELKNTYFTPVVNSEKNEALSYNIQKTYTSNQKINFSSSAASGGILASALDVNRFLMGLFQGKIISTESLEKMLPETADEYGFGIEKLPFKNPVGFAHSGRTENYISYYWFFPKENFAITTVSNAINIDIDDVCTKLLQYAYGQAITLPNFNHIDAVDDEIFKSIKGTYKNNKYKYTITISSDGTNLIFQDSRTGQMYVPFEFQSPNIFVMGNIVLEFLPKKKKLVVKQHQNQRIFKKI